MHVAKPNIPDLQWTGCRYDDGVARLLRRFADAYAAEMATHTDWVAPPAPDAPGEGPGRYGVCCNRTAACYCV